MVDIPLRTPLALSFRKPLTYLERGLILPNISPSYYAVAGIVLSLLFFVVRPAWLQILIVLLVLLTDWLDGATTRRYGICCKEGYMMDVVIDRASEGLIFVAASGTGLGKAFFLLWLFNLALALYSLKVNTHISLPLRLAFILALITRL
jgi:phosphatidylglycerophosphate synthase